MGGGRMYFIPGFFSTKKEMGFRSCGVSLFRVSELLTVSNDVDQKRAGTQAEKIKIKYYFQV